MKLDGQATKSAFDHMRSIIAESYEEDAVVRRVGRNYHTSQIELEARCLDCDIWTQVSMSERAWMYEESSIVNQARQLAREACPECLATIDWIAYPRDF